MNINQTQDDVQDDEVIGRAFRKSLIVVAVLATVILMTIAAVNFWPRPEVAVKKTDIELPQPRIVEPDRIPEILLTDITSSAGIGWQHVSGMEGEKLLPETMGGGVAVFDFDQDGDQDLLFVGGEQWPWCQDQSSPSQSLCL